MYLCKIFKLCGENLAVTSEQKQCEKCGILEFKMSRSEHDYNTHCIFTFSYNLIIAQFGRKLLAGGNWREAKSVKCLV